MNEHFSVLWYPFLIVYLKICLFIYIFIDLFIYFYLGGGHNPWGRRLLAHRLIVLCGGATHGVSLGELMVKSHDPRGGRGRPVAHGWTVRQVGYTKVQRLASSLPVSALQARLRWQWPAVQVIEGATLPTHIDLSRCLVRGLKKIVMWWRKLLFLFWSSLCRVCLQSSLAHRDKTQNDNFRTGQKYFCSL